MVLCMGLISSHLSRKSWNKMYFCFSGSSCILCICDNSQSTGRKMKSDRVCCFKDKVAKPKTTKEWVRGCVSVVGGDLSPFINFICAENSVMHQNITQLADYIDHDVFHSFPQWILLWMLTMVFGHHFERNISDKFKNTSRAVRFKHVETGRRVWKPDNPAIHVVAITHVCGVAMETIAPFVDATTLFSTFPREKANGWTHQLSLGLLQVTFPENSVVFLQWIPSFSHPSGTHSVGRGPEIDTRA